MEERSLDRRKDDDAAAGFGLAAVSEWGSKRGRCPKPTCFRHCSHCRRSLHCLERRRYMIRKSLSYRVLVLDPIPFADTEKTPEGDARMFQPIAVTLITGETDGVLVDPPMTSEQTEAVG